MTWATGSAPELLWPGLHAIWGDNYKDWEPLWEKIWQKETTKLAFDKEQGLTGLGLAGIKGQGAPITYQDPFQGFQKEYVQLTYAMGTSVTAEMVFHEQYNYINKLPRMLARSMRQTEETVHWNHINNATSASFTGADGVALSSASHVLVNGATYANQPTTASDLTQAALEQAFIDISNYVDDQGLRINLKPVWLVVSTSDRFNAERILETKYAVGSADNDINPIEGKLKLLVVPWITDTDQWTLVTDVDNGFKSLWAWESKMDRDNDFNTKNLMMTCDMRFSSGWTDPHCAYISAGA